ncbi:hypothetical protein [Burkholderia cepacia]|nr:hypothetical protein [Burkholderia cepacia]
MRRVPPRRARGDRACGHVAAPHRVLASAREAAPDVSGGGMARVDLKKSDTFIFRTPKALNDVLLTDWYEPTVMQAGFDAGMSDAASVEFSVRALPGHRAYLLAAGLAPACLDAFVDALASAYPAA